MAGLWAKFLGLGAAFAVARGAKAGATEPDPIFPPPDPDLPGETPLPGYPAHPATVARVVQWRTAIRDAAERFDLHPSLVAGVVAVESSGRPVHNPAGGGRGAWGLMQVRQAALTDYNQAHDTAFTLEQLVDVPALGIEVGSGYLAICIRNMGGNQYDGLRAYKNGVAGAKRDPQLGRDYARLVQNVAVPAYVGEV